MFTLAESTAGAQGPLLHYGSLFGTNIAQVHNWRPNFINSRKIFEAGRKSYNNTMNIQ